MKEYRSSEVIKKLKSVKTKVKNVPVLN